MTIKIDKKSEKTVTEKSNFVDLFKVPAKTEFPKTKEADQKPINLVSLSRNKPLFAPQNIKTETKSIDSTSLFKVQEKTLFNPLTDNKEIGQKSTNSSQNISLFVSQNNKIDPIFSLNPSQEKPLFTPQNNEVKTKEIENKPNLFSSTAIATENLFSSGKTATNSLFGSPSKNIPNFAFEKKATPGDEANNNLFSQLAIKSNTIDASNLFSSNVPSKTFLKVFATPEDPAKKKTFLFLNKLESDVLLKVENEEFPAHKYILSEKCKFFKNMFASNF